MMTKKTTNMLVISPIGYVCLLMHLAYCYMGLDLLFVFVNRSEGVPERRIFSLGALLGWVVRDSVFLVVVVIPDEMFIPSAGRHA